MGQHLRVQDWISSHVFFRLYFPLRSRSNRAALESFRYKQQMARAPLDQIQKVQRSRLRELLSFCGRANPFYRERFRAAGWRDESFFNAESLVELPPLTKAEVQENFPSMLSEGRDRKDWQLNSSGGLTGNHVNLIQDDAYRVQNLATRLTASWCHPKTLGPLRPRWIV